MLNLKSKKREIIGEKVKELRAQGILPAVLYGPKIDNLNIQLDLIVFNEMYKEAGASTLISLEVGDPSVNSGQVKKFSVLIHEVRRDPITGDPIHVDFYQPILTEEVEATVNIVFEGEAPAIKDLGGTLVKEIQEITVKALPQNLPHEIIVNVEGLKTFEDEVLVKDLKVADNVTIQKEPNEVVVLVTPAEKVEEELEKPVEEGETVVEGEEKEEGQEEAEEKPEPASAEATADKGKKNEK